MATLALNHIAAGYRRIAEMRRNYPDVPFQTDFIQLYEVIATLADAICPPPPPPQIDTGSRIRVTIGARTVIGVVTRVLNREPYWDIEYRISDCPARWKQNVDGGTVELLP